MTSNLFEKTPAVQVRGDYQASRPNTNGDGAFAGVPEKRTFEKNYRLLGSFRFFLALLVTVQHFQYLLSVEDRQIFRIFGFGEIAVAVFFVISGFIVAEASDKFYAGRPGAFLLNRGLRIVPPYVAALGLSIIVHSLLWHWGELRLFDYQLTDTPLKTELIIGNLFSFLPGFRASGVFNNFEFIPFVWTLRVEISFYVLTFAAYGLIKLAGPRLRYVMGNAAFAAGFAIFAAFVLLGKPEIMVNVPHFMLGMAGYFAWQKPSWDRKFLLLACLGATLWAFWLCPHRPSFRIPGAQLAVFVVLLPILGSLIAFKRITPRLKRIDTRLGELSYPLYLNHYVVCIGVYSLTDMRSPAVLFCAGVGSIALAIVMNKIVETPMKTLRDRVRGHTL